MKNGILGVIVVIAWLLVAYAGCQSLGAQGHGFQLRGPLVFAGYSAGEPNWVIGKGVRLVVPSPVLHKHLLELEGQHVRITVEAYK